MSDIAPQGERRRPDGAPLVIAVCLAGLAALIAWSTYGATTAGMRTQVGPKVFPYIIAGILAVLAVVTFIAGLRKAAPVREKDDIAPTAWIVGGLAAQMMLLTTAGFSIATGILFAATAAGFGRRKLWITLPVGIALAFVLFLIFGLGLRLSLPRGPLENLVT